MTLIMYYLYQKERSPSELLNLLNLIGNRKYYDIAVAELKVLNFIDERNTGNATGDKKMLFVTTLGLTKKGYYENINKDADLSRAAKLNRR